MFLMPNFELIGAQKMCLNVISALDKSKYDISITVSTLTGKLLEEPNLPTIYSIKQSTGWKIWSQLQTLLSSFILARIINKTQPDIVVSISPWMNFVLLFSQFFHKGSKPFIIIEEHQHLTTSFKLDADSHPFIMRILYKNFLWLYNKADIIKCVSDASKKDFADNWHIQASKIEVINPPINTVNLTQLASQKVDTSISSFLKDADKVLFALGRLEKQKDFILLIDSFKLVLKNKPNAKLVILGDGSVKSDLRAHTKELNIEENVFIPGFIENPFPVFSIADAFCLTSIWEGMPAVLIEAMALNCPVISVDCPSGPSEMIESKKNGILVTRNILDIADAINYLFDNPSICKELAENAKIKAQQWDVKEYIKKFSTLLEFKCTTILPSVNV